MNPEEEKEMLAYVRKQNSFWKSVQDDIKSALIFAIIITPILVVGLLLLSNFAPEFLERLLSVLRWAQERRTTNEKVIKSSSINSYYRYY